MDLPGLPAAVAAAGARLEALPDDLAPEAAALILAEAKPPRRTGALDRSGRVDGSSVVFGGGVVTYAAVVEAASPYLAPATDTALGKVLDLAASKLSTATTL